MQEIQEIRKVARAYFDGQNEEDRRVAWRFFVSLDENGDSKVSLEEYKKLVDSRFSSDHLFELLDANRDGTLEFEEVLALYYMDNVLIPRCSACHVMLLSSSYFSCLPCLGKASYHLCCRCYGGELFLHHHPSSEFADTRALLKLMDRLMTEAEVATAAQPAIDKEVEKGASSSVVKSNQSSPTSTQSRTEVEKGASSNVVRSKQSSPTSTRSKTATIVSKLAVCATKTIIIKGVATVAIASGCCIM